MRLRPTGRLGSNWWHRKGILMCELVRDLQPEAGNARDISRMETHQRAGEPAVPPAEGLMFGLDHEKVCYTLERLRILQELRVQGVDTRAYYTSDVPWLVHMAINRKAGWSDDPSLSRGSARPVEGRYPPKAHGDYLKDLRLLSGRLKNRGRVEVRELRPRLAKRLF